LAEKVVKERGAAKIITATNVIAHIDDLHDTFSGIATLLDKESVFIGEFPYLPDLLARNEFDTIYHEHLSYFSLHALTKLFEQHQLNLFDVKKMPVHGGSIRIYAAPSHSSQEPSLNLQRFLDNERALNLLDVKSYHSFAQRVANIKNDLLDLLRKLRKEGKRVVGYGASAKGNVLFNYCGIGPDLIEYIVDSIPYKQGRFTPGTHIPIYPEKKLELDMPDYALILAWNFADEIMRKQSKYREKGGQFIITIPTLRIE
ncbi:methyltransferase domain-containing protein, partial [Candidatus Berkelbacteria bacterium]|nr:methyltransferase domain-containing protein [Candidatus Berkelbacteria bacterium]